MRPLNRPWWDRFAEWEAKALFSESDALDVADWFIARHAADAEKHGWQPAHLMGKRGLARMWASALYVPSQIVFEHLHMVYAVEGLVIGRRAARDGSCPLVTGAELTALKGRHLAFVSVAQ